MLPQNTARIVKLSIREVQEDGRMEEVRLRLILSGW